MKLERIRFMLDYGPSASDLQSGNGEVPLSSWKLISKESCFTRWGQLRHARNLYPWVVQMKEGNLQLYVDQVKFLRAENEKKYPYLDNKLAVFPSRSV